MKQYDEVFALIKNGELDLTEFSLWLNAYYNQSYTDGYEDGYKNCNEDILMGGSIR